MRDCDLSVADDSPKSAVRALYTLDLEAITNSDDDEVSSYFESGVVNEAEVFNPFNNSPPCGSFPTDVDPELTLQPLQLQRSHVSGDVNMHDIIASIPEATPSTLPATPIMTSSAIAPPSQLPSNLTASPLARPPVTAGEA